MIENTYEKKALKALYELGWATMKARTIPEIFDNILEKAVQIMGVEKASIMRFDRKDGLLKIIAAKGMPKSVMESVSVKVGEGISGRVFSTKKPLLVKDLKGGKGSKNNKRYKSRSLISAPVSSFALKVKGIPVGVINMTDKKDKKPFTPQDLELLTTIAAQAAAYIRVYDMVDDLKDSDRMKKDLEVAREIQLALLPDRMPELKGVDVYGVSLMAERIGGDYFDILNRGWAPPAFVVADVSGHDIGAALLMSAFRSALRSEVGIPVLPPSTVVRRMNKVMYDDLVRAEQFISVSYFQYINSSKMLRYSTAGHHPALLYSPKNGAFKELVTDGPLLGIERGEHFFEGVAEVAKGDVVVIYTDGLTEAKSAKAPRYGVQRLKKMISGSAKSSPKKIVDAILGDVKKFMTGATVKDDITLLVLKFR